MIFTVLFAALFLLSATVFPTGDAGRNPLFRIKTKMEEAQVVPDMIDSVPVDILRITYGARTKVQMGNELTPTQVKDLPTEVRWPTQPKALYTLIMADLDAPSRADPKDREGLHWLVVNIPGNDLDMGEVFTEYIGSGAPLGTGLHRYVTLVFKQNGKLNLTREKTSNRSAAGRFGFKTRDFVKENNLHGPVAGNFFFAKYDSYVTTLHAQLGALPAQSS